MDHSLSVGQTDISRSIRFIIRTRTRLVTKYIETNHEGYVLCPEDRIELPGHLF